MANSYLNTALGKVQSFLNTIGSDSVHAPARVAVDTAGVAITGEIRKVKWSPSAIYTSSTTAGNTLGKVIHQPALISGLTRGTDASGTLHAVRVLDKGDQGGDFDILLMNASISIGSNGADLALSDADADSLFNRVKIFTADFEDQTNNLVAIKENLGKTLFPVSGSASVYVALVARNTSALTRGASDLEITFEVY